MPVSWGKKQGKAFMITSDRRVSKTNHRQIISAFVACCALAGVLILQACEPDLSDDPIRVQPFSPVYINLNLPEYNSLRTIGGYKYIDDVGVRGIILYHKDVTTYIAFERNCSYQPNDACATVEVHNSGLYLVDHCCNSTFDLNTGSPTGGVAWRPLLKYETLVSGSELTITDAVIE